MHKIHSLIGLLNHIGGGNLGDDATIGAVLQNIRQRWPDVAITAFSQNPSDTSMRHGIAAHPIRTQTWSFGYKPAPPVREGIITNLTRRHKYIFVILKAIYALLIRWPRTLLNELSFMAKSFRHVKSLDVLIICGGGQLTEWGGPWGFPYTIFKWVLLARLARTSCLFLNVGAGPLTHPISKLLAARALGMAQYVSFRDEKSQALARAIGFSGKSQVLPDSVYSFPISETHGISKSKRDQQIVGVAPMPFCDPRTDPAQKDQARYEEFIGSFSQFAASLTRESYSLTLFGTDIGVDPLAIEDLRHSLRHHHGIMNQRCGGATSIPELLMLMSNMDYVVTCRFHGVIFAHLLNKPVLAVSHHPKVKELMRCLGLSEFCIEIEKIDPSLLISKFILLVRDAEQIKSHMNSVLMDYRSQLVRQFDGLFPSQHRKVIRGRGVRIPATSIDLPLRRCDAEFQSGVN